MTPRQRMSPFQSGAPSAGLSLRADGRMDAVGGDQQRAVDTGGARPLRVDEVAVTPSSLSRSRRGDGAALSRRPEPLPHCAVEEHLQLAAMDRVLRPAIAGLLPARLGPDQLAALRNIGELRGRDRGLASASSRPSSVSSRTACGSMLMPTPSGFTSGTLSNTRHGTPIWWRLNASRKAADAAADDQYRHRFWTSTMVCPSWQVSGEA